MLSWLHDHHRRELLESPFPAEWLAYLNANVAYYALLTSAEQAKLRDDLRVLVADKHWEGCGGLVMTPEIQVTVAAQACLLLLGLPGAEFKAVESILVYPQSVLVPRREVLWKGLWFDKGQDPTDALAGQASQLGATLLSWDNVLYGGRHPAQDYNVVLHEFAHVLDFEDGASNGVPRIPDELLAEWAEVMAAEYQALVENVREGKPTLLRDYGAKSAAEFFAVVTECFFGIPVKMRDAHPRLYKLLRHYYQQDTAARFERAAPTDPEITSSQR